MNLDNILVTKEENGIYSANTYIVEKNSNSIVIPGIVSVIPSESYDGEAGLAEEAEETEPIIFSVERRVPDMEYITEYGNRLWGCSKDGHEIYCCKLGDVKNGIALREFQRTHGRLR